VEWWSEAAWPTWGEEPAAAVNQWRTAAALCFQQTKEEERDSRGGLVISKIPGVYLKYKISR